MAMSWPWPGTAAALAVIGDRARLEPGSTLAGALLGAGGAAGDRAAAVAARQPSLAAVRPSGDLPPGRGFPGRQPAAAGAAAAGRAPARRHSGQRAGID